MASTHDSTSPGNHYSNLEAVYPTEPGHLSLHPGYRNGDDGTEGKETWQGVEEVRDEKVAGVEGFMSRRYWGRSSRTLFIIAAVLIAVIVGASVGGVKAAQLNRNKPPPNPTSTTSSLSSSTETSTATATPAIVPPVIETPAGLFFSPENWYTFNNHDVEDNYWTQTYAEDTTEGSLKIARDYSDTANPPMTDMHYQIRPVPATWKNSTYRTGGNKEKTYWISCRSSGPGVRLTMLGSEWYRAENNMGNSIHIHPQPNNHDDDAQYWYFKAVDGPGGATRYKLYNMRGGPVYPVVYNYTWGNPLMYVRGDIVDFISEEERQWRVEPRSRIVNGEEKFTWEIDAGPDVFDYVPGFVPG